MSSATNQTRERHMVYGRILMTFMVVVIVIDGLAVGIYLSGSRIVGEKARDALLSQIEFHFEGLVGSVERMYGLQVELVNDERFDRIAVLPDSLTGYDRIRIFLDVEARLSGLESLSEYVSDIVVYLPASATRIAAGRIESPINSGEWQSLLAVYSTDSLIRTIGGRLFVLFAHPSPTGGRIPSFVTSAELSLESHADLTPVLPDGARLRTWLFGTTQSWRVGGFDEAWDRHLMPQSVESLVMNRIQRGDESGIITDSVHGEEITVAFAYSRTLGASLIWQLADPALFPAGNTLSVLFVILVAVTILFVPVFSLMVYRLVHVPVLELVHSFAEVERGNLGVHAQYRGRNEFEYLRQAFNSMSTRLSNLFDEVFHHKMLAAESELRALQAQINPHFLYNSLFVLYRIIQAGKQSEAAELTRGLARYYQEVTQSSSTEVSLSRDVEHAKVYCSIQSVRLGERVSTHFADMPYEVSVLPVPRLSFQPIVENCYEHAFGDPEIRGAIFVSYSRSDDRWVITVEDNGDGMPEGEIDLLNAAMSVPPASTKRRMSALYNVHRRLQLLYGCDGGLSFRRSEYGGLAVVITLVKE